MQVDDATPTCKSLLRQIAKVFGKAIEQLVLAFCVIRHFNRTNGRDRATTVGKLKPFLISRDLAQLLQGKIELESTLGQGATFSLILPWQIKDKSVPLMPDLNEAQSPQV